MKKFNLLFLFLLVILTGCFDDKKEHDHAKKNHQEKVISEEEPDEENLSEMMEADHEKDTGSNKKLIESLKTDRVAFNFNSDNVPSNSHAFLDELIKFLHANEKMTIEIQGNCDKRGSAAYNIALGERRANMIRNYLIKHGVAEKKITVVSFGSRILVAGDTEEVFAKNRVGIILVK